jgi:O-antigen/teichoic acid export membrane protein
MKRMFNHISWLNQREHLRVENLNLRRRAWEAIASVTLSRLVRIGEQFILVPIYLSAWGVDTYGEWLTLTAITTFLSLTNVGLGQAAASEIVMAIGAGDHERAQRVFSSSAFMLSVIALVVIAVLAAISLHADISALAGFTKIAHREAAVITLCTGATVVLSFFCAPLYAVFSTIIGAGRANLLPTSIKIGEVILTAFAVLLGGTPAIVALIILLSVIITVGSYLAAIHGLAQGLRVLSFKLDKESLLRMLKPSLGNFSLFLSVNMIGSQLPRIILFSMLGSSAVAIFTVTSTYTRVARVFSGIIPFALQVDVGHAYGAGDVLRFVDFVKKMCRISVWSAIFLGSGLFLCSFFLIPFWTNGRVSVDVILLLSLIAGSIVGSLVDPILAALTIINRIGAIGLVHFLSLLLGLVISSVFLVRFGPAAVAIALIVPEVAVILFGRSELGRRGGEEPMRLREFIRWPGDLLHRELSALLHWSLVAKLLGR